MLMQHVQNQLYRIRSFNDKFTDTMNFLRQEWKPLLIFLTYFLLPLCLVQALALPDLFSAGSLAGNTDTASRLMISMGFFGLCAFLGEIFVISIVYSLMRIHYFRPEGSAGLTFRTFWPDIRKSIGRAVLLMLLVTGLALLAVGIFVLFVVVTAKLSLFMIIVDMLILPALLVLALPLALAMPRALLTDEGIWTALKNGYRLGWKTLGGVLAIYIVLYFIVGLVQSICSMPAMVFMFLDMLSGLGEDIPFADNPLYHFAEYLSNILYSFVNYAGAAVLLVGTGIQYGHAAEKIDGVTAEESITAFDTL